MTDPIHSANPDPWAGSPAKRVDAAERRRRSQVRERRSRRRYGSYWAAVTALLGIAGVVALV